MKRASQGTLDCTHHCTRNCRRRRSYYQSQGVVHVGANIRNQQHGGACLVIQPLRLKRLERCGVPARQLLATKHADQRTHV